MRLARKWWVVMDEKYDKLVRIGKAVASFRANIGKYESAKIAFLRSYLNDLGTDADLLREFMSHIRADEEAALRERYPHEMERTDRILADTTTLNTLPEVPGAPAPSQPAVSAADIHNIVHTAVQTANGTRNNKHANARAVLSGDVIEW